MHTQQIKYMKDQFIQNNHGKHIRPECILPEIIKHLLDSCLNQLTISSSILKIKHLNL